MAQWQHQLFLTITIPVDYQTIKSTHACMRCAGEQLCPEQHRATHGAGVRALPVHSHLRGVRHGGWVMPARNVTCTIMGLLGVGSWLAWASTAIGWASAAVSFLTASLLCGTSAGTFLSFLRTPSPSLGASGELFLFWTWLGCNTTLDVAHQLLQSPGNRCSNPSRRRLHAGCWHATHTAQHPTLHRAHY